MKVTKKGILVLILFVVLLLTIGILATIIAKDPLLYAIMGYVLLALLSVGAIIFNPFASGLKNFRPPDLDVKKNYEKG
jgi:hypothetical protein